VLFFRISDGTWALINHWAALRRAGKLNQCGSRVIGRRIKAALVSNCKQRAVDVGDKIKMLMAAGEVKEAWNCLKGWYATVEDHAPKANHDMLVQQTEERIALYSHAPHPGGPLPINVQPFDICNNIPTDSEIREVVRELWDGRAAGAMGLQAEHIKVWLQDVVQEEKEQSIVGRGNKWCIFVKLMQTIWERGCMPEQMTWEIIILLPKGGGNYRGIGLLEPCWKAVEKIIVKPLALIEFHDCLHGGLPKRGTGTASIKAKLVQQLVWWDQCPFYEIYVDLKKAYDAIDRSHMMEILKVYGVGPKLLRLQNSFWENAKLVCHAGGCYGSPFAAKKGITQGGPLSLLMFNLCVDAVVREWLHQVLGDDAMRGGIGDDVAKWLVAFYIDNGLVASRDPVWLQSFFDVLVGLFECIGLFTNASKTKVMTCILGRIREGYTEEEYTNIRSGAETAANRKRRRVDYQICGDSLQAGSLKSHLETQHGVYCLFVLSRDIVVECPAIVYHAIVSTDTGRYFCPVANCVGGANTWWNLCRHFQEHHPQDLVVCPSEGYAPLPRCTRCGMQTAAGALMRNHQKTELCKERWHQRVQHETAATA
jgi:hypothetical protein